jgi:hypothetical protein
MPMLINWLLPAILSTTAGAVDAIGFLALGGLFTAHITGNLVVLTAYYVTGGFNQVAPLLSVPVFVAVLGALTLAVGTPCDFRASRRTLLILQLAFLGGSLGNCDWPLRRPRQRFSDTGGHAVCRGNGDAGRYKYHAASGRSGTPRAQKGRIERTGTSPTPRQGDLSMCRRIRDRRSCRRVP